MRPLSLAAGLSLFALLVAAAPAAAVPYDTPTIAVIESAPAFIAVDVTAGASGAPAGFTIDWMKRSDYDALGGWPTDIYAPGFAYCIFDGAPTLNMTSGVGSYNIGADQTVRVVLGELFDETGVYTNYTDEMPEATQYVLRIRAEGDLNGSTSANSENYSLTTTPGNNCTHTQGYWKTHGLDDCHQGNNDNEWPVTSLTLGTNSYTQAQLCSILNTPAQGNGLISLAHQLIAAKLNIANGADAAAIAATIAAADALIGGLLIPPVGAGYLAPSSTSSLTTTLDRYNNGLVGPPHCDAVPAKVASWGALKVRYH